MRNSPYIFGHSKAELRRQAILSSLIEPITERLLREAGLRPGMRVLDLGCGGGDVSLLLAELVGTAGSVTGIDCSAEFIKAARLRARALGHVNIEFHWESVEDFYDPDAFDMVVGRSLLIHQADPVRFLRAAASHVRPGSGVLAFQEAAVHQKTCALPPVPLVQQVRDWTMAAFRTLPHPDAAGRMFEHFQEAGLPQPAVFSEMLVGGGPDCPFYGLAALTMAILLPELERKGITTAAEVGVDTLADRMRAAVTKARSQLFFPAQVCGWTRC
jgi:ubiquinone/menaquinone biosynthesis C-methylase UbiE